VTEPNEPEQPKAEPGGYAPSVAERLAFYQRAGGVVTPLFTVLLAFLAGGLVVLATGHNPLRTYKAVWNGTGLNWFFAFGHHHIDIPFTNHQVFFWWDTNTNLLAAYNLTQTAILTATLICTGLAVAFAFRCGLFNIGGQGQYITGAIVSVWVGSSWAGMAQGLHVFLAIALAMLAGAGIAALVVFWLILNRTTLGYQVRAVGFNPEAARYGGISVARNYVWAMAIAGAFAGLGGAIDILGWQYRLGVLDIQVSNIGFIGIAVALLGRNTALGVGLAALLFGSLVNGTSTRGLDPSVFPPQLAGNLTLMIQGLVLLFVGADVLVLYVWQARRKLGRNRQNVEQPVAT
jgi:ABC-type uncharacterized transport system permease subunit